MPVSFRRLRIAGFKSFAEPTIVEIMPGLTGIVGPNGCGKSNVVEALRWAMGESSARSLRGGEMDDVIFAGTAARASRNLAEVTLHLEDTAGVAPPPFHEAPDLEIVRRIERGQGSAYRVNGREARARDVQTLFNDLATGAHSSGLVSQGRVGALVSAKPDERRRLLEEAAGITGLHSRRHEAELKLRAAEANLERAEDLRGQLETQLEALKRQARQANRYRSISGLVRAAEAELLALQRAWVETARVAARQAQFAAEQAVAAATTEAATNAAQAAEAAAALPPLRSVEGEARTALERARIGAEQLGHEETRAREALAAAEARLRQTGYDLGHARNLVAEAEITLARLAQEDAELASAEAAHPPRMRDAETAALESADAVHTAEAEANRLTEHAAALAARHAALTAALAQSEQRVRRLAQQADQIAAEQARLAANRVAPGQLAAVEEARAAAGTARDAARIALAQAESTRAAGVAEAATTRAARGRDAASTRAAAIEAAAAARRAATEAAAAHRAQSRAAAEKLRAEAGTGIAAARATESETAKIRARLAAETQALSQILAVADGEKWPKMVDQLTVPEGLEAALGAALGEELESGANATAARHWRELPPLPDAPLPEGVVPLATLVQAPPALGRALARIGLTDDGEALQASLAPGQLLVSRAGAVWRWDGYTIHAGTPSAAAVRLQQRNHLGALKVQLASATDAAAQAAAALAAAESQAAAARAQADQMEQTGRAEADALERIARTDAEAAERAANLAAQTAESEARAAEEAVVRRLNAAEAEARANRSAAEQRATAAGEAAARLAAQDAEAKARLTGLADQAERVGLDLAEARAALEHARAELAALADPAAARAEMERARTALAEARGRESAARADRDALARSAAGRAHRRRTIAAETIDWSGRAADAKSRLTDLTARSAEVEAEHAALAAAPAAIAIRRSQAIDALEAAEAAHRRAADALMAAEAAAQATDRAARAAEHTLASARENIVRGEAEVAAAEQAWGVVAERILERLGATPSLPEPPADLSAEAEEKSRRKLDRLQREREEMGPVNLRAEIESEALAKQIETIVHERGELTTAIAKLRGSIGHLNREGRERLAAVFAQVDQHFQTLFARMFQGGRAHLALVGSDDPLEAGLEIYAQPPGKKLATLSLLSGGEQALTALSLIFAVFRCNPAPVCVLDEVDAPLDDANVDRFCTLLEDMVRETNTRFLVVTHHALTMARMDRLYGVTMQERGVSRVLSVDLQRASEMVDPPRMAAE